MRGARTAFLHPNVTMRPNQNPATMVERMRARPDCLKLSFRITSNSSMQPAQKPPDKTTLSHCCAVPIAHPSGPKRISLNILRVYNDSVRPDSVLVGTSPISAVVSMGQRNTRLEPALH